MSRNRQRRLFRTAAIVAAVSITTGCGLLGEDTRVLLRSDPPMAGYTASMKYTINASPNGASQTNSITYQGINNASPMPLLTTTFGQGASTRNEIAQVTSADGSAINALSMVRWSTNIGLTDYLDTSATTYEQRDALGNRKCGAKIRLDFKPNIAQVIKSDRYRRAWDTLFYYTIPCGDITIASPDSSSQAGDTSTKKGSDNTATPAPGKQGTATKIVKPNMTLDLSKATFLGMVIDQQFTPRVTGKPILFNRGHSVTIVGGRAAKYVGGWWQSPAGLLNASNLVIDMVKDLDRNEWLSFSDASYGGLVYSAGDADVYLSLKRIFLNRQSAYLINFRSTPSEQWKRVLINPIYNEEWNDLSQNYHAVIGQDMPDIDSLIDKQTGLPKDFDNPDSDNTKKLKEIERAGCQNCQNPTLEQIQFVNETTGSSNFDKPLYAMTIRGYIGSTRSLVLFGKVPDSLDSFSQQAQAHQQELGMNSCPIRRNDKGEVIQDQQYTAGQCADWLREGALWDLLTHDASKFGFDVVGQYSVVDNSTYASQCTGSGDSTSCTTVPVDRRLDGSYLFTDSGEKLQKAWTVMQLLGEVGMRTLGMSYASGQYDGSGLDFAMAQPQVYNTYYTNMNDPALPYNPELLFALDARALQLPNTLGLAGKYLGLQ